MSASTHSLPVLTWHADAFFKHRPHVGKTPTRRPEETKAPLTKCHIGIQIEKEHKKGTREDTVVSLEPACAHSVCNEVWWRPCPTNLPPPVHSNKSNRDYNVNAKIHDKKRSSQPAVTDLREVQHVGLQHSEGEHAVRDVARVRWHAEFHEDVDGQDTASRVQRIRTHACKRHQGVPEYWYDMKTRGWQHRGAPATL